MTSFPLLLLTIALSGIPPSENELDIVPGSDHVVTGVITAALGHTFVIENGTNRLDLYCTDYQAFATGDVIAASCKLNRRLIGEPSRILVKADVLRREAAPAPANLSLEQILREQRFLTPVRICGTMDDIAPDEIDPRYLQVVIRSGAATVTMALSHEDLSTLNGAESLLHAEVELTGICVKRVPTNRFLSGPVFLPFGTSAIRIVKPAADVFRKPRIPTSGTVIPSEFASLGLRTIVGTVVATWGRNNVLLRSGPRDNVDCHRIELASGIPPPPIGARIEVVGQPETDLYRINLSRALFRSLSAKAAPSSPPETPRLSDIIDNGYYRPGFFGKIVKLRGTVTALPRIGTSDARLHLTANGTDFTLDASTCPEALSDCDVGCVLDVCGACLLESDNWRPNAPLPTIRGLSVLARSPRDVRIVTRPPWWTAGRLAILVASLLAILSAVLIWNRVLNRLVVRRSRELLREQSARNASELRIGERTRLAVELHDTLSQNLAGVACQVASAKNAVGTDDEVSRQRLFTAERMLKSCRTELRQVLSDLRSEALECASLEEALRTVLVPISGEAELTIRFNVPRSRLMDSTVHAILCIVRELVGNAIRHGGASRVRIAGALEPERIRFSVQENGTGFDLESCAGPAQGHFGLDGIRNRISRFGGTFDLETAPRKGSYAVIGIPLPGHDEKAAEE